jgi:flagellin
VIATDFNSDGYQDLVVGVLGVETGDDTAVEFRSFRGGATGLIFAGSFSHQIAGGTPGSVSISKFNLEQFGSNFSFEAEFNNAPDSSGTITLGSDGIFSNYIDGVGFASGNETSVSADFNGDGINDQVIAAGTSSYTVTQRLQNTTTTITTSIGSVDISQTVGSIVDVTNARAAIDSLTTLRDTVSAAQGNLGVGLSRLESAVQVLRAAVNENSAAKDRILSSDTAQDVANLNKQQILQNVTIAVLAQANLQPALAIQLLRGS